MVTLAMENTDELREAVLDRLKKNGTLNRIQAELRSAIFLAIEQKEEDIKEDEPCDDEKSIEYALILHYLRQNRLSATAAVFEKEINRKLIAIENIDQKLISKDRLFDAFTANISRHEAESSVTLPTEAESRTSAALSDIDSNKRFTRQSQAESSQIVEEKRSEPPTASLPIQSTVNRSPKEMNKETKGINQKTACSNLYNAISSSSSSSTRSTSSTDRSLSFDHKNKKGSEENEKAEKLDYNPGSNKVASRSVALKENESSGKFGDNYDEKTKSKEAKKSYKKTGASEEASLISLSSRSDRTAEKNATNQQKSSSTTDQPEPNSVAGSVKRGGSLPPLRDKQIPNELQHLPSIDSSREQSNQVDTAQITRRLSSILNLQSSDSDENIGEEITVDELLHSNDEDSISF